MPTGTGRKMATDLSRMAQKKVGTDGERGRKPCEVKKEGCQRRRTRERRKKKRKLATGEGGSS